MSSITNSMPLSLIARSQFFVPKALAGMSAGQTLKVLATDPGSVKDFEAFARQTGNELLQSDEEESKYRFF